MAAPVAARRVLFPLFAFNQEVARAPWVTSEEMIAEMRLQWWRDVLTEIAGGGPVRRHEVTDPLAEVLDATGARALDGLIAARRWDIYRDAFEDADHFDAYIDATAGTLLWTAARLLGASDEGVVRDLAYGIGLAAFLQAIPALEAAKRRPLIDGTPEGVRALAQKGLARFDRGRTGQGGLPKLARAALLTGWDARRLLSLAVAEPRRVADGTLVLSPFRDRTLLAKAALTGRI